MFTTTTARSTREVGWTLLSRPGVRMLELLRHKAFREPDEVLLSRCREVLSATASEGRIATRVRRRRFVTVCNPIGEFGRPVDPARSDLGDSRGARPAMINFSGRNLQWDFSFLPEKLIFWVGSPVQPPEPTTISDARAVGGRHRPPAPRNATRTSLLAPCLAMIATVLACAAVRPGPDADTRGTGGAA